MAERTHSCIPEPDNAEIVREMRQKDHAFGIAAIRFAE